MQVVVSETNRTEQQRGYLTLAPEWRVSNFDTAETALLDGVGYGCMPRHRIEGLLRSGRLQQLHIDNRQARKTTYYIVPSRPLTNGSEAQQLAQLLARDQ
jgi:DNA-binding transcriptional LysR family regulator